MSNEQDLAAFQAALLDVLGQPGPGETLLLRLSADPRSHPFRDYVAGFEPRMMEMAATLMRRWTDIDLAA